MVGRALDNKWISRAGNAVFLLGLALWVVHRVSGWFHLPGVTLALIASGVVLMLVPHRHAFSRGQQTDAAHIATKAILKEDGLWPPWWKFWARRKGLTVQQYDDETARQRALAPESPALVLGVLDRLRITTEAFKQATNVPGAEDVARVPNEDAVQVRRAITGAIATLMHQQAILGDWNLIRTQFVPGERGKWEEVRQKEFLHQHTRYNAAYIAAEDAFAAISRVDPVDPTNALRLAALGKIGVALFELQSALEAIPA